MNTVDWTKALVAIDTTSKFSNLALIDLIQSHLKGLGLAPWLAYNHDKSKANLFVTLPDAQGNIAGGTILSGHTDVVPVSGQNWQSNPFEPHIADGKLYGRGTCDMKGFIGASLALLPAALAKPLNTPLHLAFSYDEEIGCLGAPVMLDALQQHGLSPSACIVGEPTSMKMVVAHKGINSYKCSVHGHAAHSSLTPSGVNAIEYAARIICFINDEARRYQANGPFDADFDVPFTTLSTGLIKGGQAMNIVPELCEFFFEYRQLPGLDAAAILAPIQDYMAQAVAQMQAVVPHARIELSQMNQVPPLDEADGSSPALKQLVAKLVNAQQKHKVAYTTEAGLFQQANITTLVCGPGDIQQAHKPDEFVSLDQLAQCDAFLNQLLASMQA
ncbi:acetylornithine deacetylase [Neisseriaceae bacterium CLB008]